MDLREKILAANDIKSELVAVAAWEVMVEVRGLTAAQRAKVLAAPGVRREDGTVDEAELSVPLIIESAHDPETKKPLFAAADLEALKGKNAGAVDQLASVALRLSGMSQDEAQTIEGNSGGTPSGGSTSASRKGSGVPCASS